MEAGGHGTSMQATSSSSAANGNTRKRKRSAQGCVHDGNDIIVEELKNICSKIRESSHLASNYQRAIASIRQHPEIIRNGKEAKQLRNIGNYIANQIQAILQKHNLVSHVSSNDDGGEGAASRRQVALQPCLPPPPATAVPAHSGQLLTAAASVSVDKRSVAVYAPAYGKQPWFVLLVLKQERAFSDAAAITVESLLSHMQRAGYDGNLTKLKTCLLSLCGTHQVIRKTATGLVHLTDKGKRSTELCPGSLSTTTSSSYSDATSFASTITIRQESSLVASMPEASLPLAQNNSQPAKISKPGIVCIELSDSENDEGNGSQPTMEEFDYGYDYDPDPEPMSELAPTVSLSATEEVSCEEEEDDCVISQSDEWELVLILDHREILSRRNRSILERKLLERNVTCEVRALNVGDMQWIARRYRNGDITEFVMNVIVERKEVKDLSGSIIDRRYAEQKLRLSACGLTHVIYLVEGSLTQQTMVRSSGLHTALCRTQLQNHFFVQLCQNADESVNFLTGVHNRMLSTFPLGKCRNAEHHTLSQRKQRFFQQSAPTQEQFERLFCHPAQTFSAFNAQFRKKTQFTVGEIYQRMLMQVPGLSASKTIGLTNAYPTIHQLRKALLGRHHENNQVENVRCGESQRRLGTRSREYLAYLLTSSNYEENVSAQE